MARGLRPGWGRDISEMGLEKPSGLGLVRATFMEGDKPTLPLPEHLSYLPIHLLLTEGPLLCLALCWLTLRTQPPSSQGSWFLERDNLSPDSGCPEWSGWVSGRLLEKGREACFNCLKSNRLLQPCGL